MKIPHLIPFLPIYNKSSDNGKPETVSGLFDFGLPDTILFLRSEVAGSVSVP